MATAGDMRDLLLYRIRAYGGTAFDTSWVRTVLSICERTVNAGIRSVLATTSVTTTAYQSIYFLRTSFSAALYDAVDIVSITATDGDGTYQLRKCTIQDLFGYTSGWFRASTTRRYRWYVQIGRDLLFLYPARTTATTLSVTYSKQTTALSADGTTMDLPDEDVPIAVDLAEIVLLTVNRITDVASIKIEALSSKLNLEAESRT